MDTAVNNVCSAFTGFYATYEAVVLAGAFAESPNECDDCSHWVN